MSISLCVQVMTISGVLVILVTSVIVSYSAETFIAQHFVKDTNV